MQCDHRTVGTWALLVVRPETRGALARALNVMSRVVALIKGAVSEGPAGHRLKAE